MQQNQYSRRRFLQIAGIGAASAFALAACPAAAPAPGGEAGEVSPSEEDLELRVTHSWDSSFWPRQVEFDEKFSDEHPGINVTPENIIWAEYVPKLTTLAAANEIA
jgi:ABC-type glycerol-3-phosphate transport system substrate-binding protein